MFEGGGLQQFKNLRISKKGNQSASIEIWDLPNLDHVRVDYEGSLPFRKEEATIQPVYHPGNPDVQKFPDTARQRFFESICHFLRLSNPIEPQVPFRFIDVDGGRWQMDKVSAFWLEQTPGWTKTCAMSERHLAFLFSDQ